MNEPWSLIDVRTLHDSTVQQQVPGVGWVPARPVRYYGFWNDLKLAWWVLRHRAEVVVWPEAQP